MSKSWALCARARHSDVWLARRKPRASRSSLDRLGRADEIDWERVSLDSASVQPRGRKTGPNPTDRAKQGSKRHAVVERRGVPLAVIQTAANVHDSKALEEAIEAVSPIRKPRGHPRKRPKKKLHADKGTTSPGAEGRSERGA